MNCRKCKSFIEEYNLVKCIMCGGSICKLCSLECYLCGCIICQNMDCSKYFPPKDFYDKSKIYCNECAFGKGDKVKMKTKGWYYCQNCNKQVDSVKDCYCMSICDKCKIKCEGCGNIFCDKCYKIGKGYPCVSHRHCKICLLKPDHCNVYPMGACGCGCGDFEISKLIWKSKKDKQKYKAYLDNKYFRK